LCTANHGLPLKEKRKEDDDSSSSWTTQKNMGWRRVADGVTLTVNEIYI
jgi:hypothetical protein